MNVGIILCFNFEKNSEKGMILFNYHRLILQEHKVSESLSNLLQIYSLFKTRWLVRRINEKLTQQLKNFEAIHQFLLLNQPHLKNQRLFPHMQICNAVHKTLYPMWGKAERALEKADDPELRKIFELLQQLINVVHDIIIVLRRNTRKFRRAPRSEEARAAVLSSNKALGRILSTYESKPT
ncbi:hypothetical protein [uncultured Chitinophaga sp.]|uniref:hypothetical protein n=1 Tax=uncultured Chitinophaga sp. TaxID=339340 RepID=UPI0025D36700|nr:hypothetical protein [uncultured Chitinophaga sp.]